MEICYDKGCNNIGVAIKKNIQIKLINNDVEETHPLHKLVLPLPGQTGIWKRWFLRGGENRSTPRKTSRSKGGNQQQTQTRIFASTPGFEPGPH